MYVFVSLPAPTQMSEQHCLEEKHRIHYTGTKNQNITMRILELLMGLNTANNDTRAPLI